jgi:hypothetical protein
MAMNKIRGAFAVPRKGETFELRAGLVYVPLRSLRWPFRRDEELMMLTIRIGLNMPTNGTSVFAKHATNTVDEGQGATWRG